MDVGMIWKGSRKGTIPRKLCDRKVEVLVWIFDTILSWVVSVRSIDLLHGTTSSALRKKGLQVCAQPPNKRLGMQAQLIDTKNQAVLQTCILTLEAR
jgi:hypothetical protein